MSEKRIRVAQVGATFIQAQRQIEYAIHNSLKKNNIESKIFYAIGNANDGNIVRYETKAEEIFRRAGNKLLIKSPIFSFFQTRRLIRYIGSFQPDIVNLHTIHHGTIDYKKLFRYFIKKQIKVVYTIHDMWPFTGGCYHFFSINCDGYLSGCKNCKNEYIKHDNPPKKSGAYFECKKELYKQLSSFCTVSVSDWTREQVEKSFLSDYDSYTIHNCIEQPIITPKDEENISALLNEVLDKKIIVAVAGLWTERKGIKLLLELADVLGEEYELILCGQLPKDNTFRIPSNVLCVGYRSPSEVACIYKKALLHVSASTEETFGMTFVEAAMQGTKSVGFACSAIKQTIESVYGYTSSCIGVQSLKALIVQAVENNSCKLSETEIMHVREEYSESKMAEEYMNVYRAILKKNEGES